MDFSFLMMMKMGNTVLKYKGDQSGYRLVIEAKQECAKEDIFPEAGP